MAEIQIKILRDHTASANGFDLQDYKRGEILTVGSSRLPISLFEWHSRNPGFSEIFVEKKIEEKAMEDAPENKAISSEQLENKESQESSIEENKTEEITSSEESSIPENKKNKFTNPFKRKK